MHAKRRPSRLQIAKTRDLKNVMKDFPETARVIMGALRASVYTKPKGGSNAGSKD